MTSRATEEDDTSSRAPSQAHEQLIARFTDACSADNRVVAAFVGGSIARGEADPYSDVDLCVVATDEAADDVFADRAAMVGHLGTPLFLEDRGHQPPEVFVILADGTDAEMFFIAEGRIKEMQVGSILTLLDRTGLLTNLELPMRAPLSGDLASELRILAWFWHDVSHVIKALGRGQLWWAAGEIEALRGYCVNLVRIEQGVEAGGEPYFKIDTEASTVALESLRSTFVTIEAEALAQAASELVAFFGSRGRPLAGAYGSEYPSELDLLMRRRLEALVERP
ncbi:MAG: nucleotidyltransferase domain-containing protein [Actinomycetota bacterium]